MRLEEEMRLCLMGLVIGCLGVVGCGPDVRANCEAEVACEGGNELDVEACVAGEDVDADYYADVGCGAEYDAYFICIEQYLKCDEQPTGETCTTNAECSDGRCSGGTCVRSSFGVDQSKIEMCEAESSAFNRCN
jgi:hypothetical protein